MALSAPQNPLTATQAHVWYPQHESYAIKTAIVPLPASLLGYLQEDGLFVDDENAGVPALDRIDAGLVLEGEYRRDDWDELPAGAPGGPALQPSPSGPLNAARGGVLTGSTHSSSGVEADRRERRESSSTASSSGVSNAGQAPDWKLRFPQLRVAIEAAIESLGGRVVPKLNWSAPTDALWISATNTLACRNADEVMLLIKSSDRVSHDVEILEAAMAAWGSGADVEATAGSPVLVLKKWQQLRPEREYRCFVRDRRLVAVSQRDISQAFPALSPDVVVDVRRRIWRFWEERLASGSRLPLDSCALDVYVPFDSPSWQSVRLVDVNPLLDTTSPLLYDWAELGFGPTAMPAAADLLSQLRTAASAAQQGDTLSDGELGSGGGRIDESWMAEAVGTAALSPPESADQLQVRIVESSGNASGGSGGATGGVSLAGLTGPMLLGSRAALAMPYDMLGITDSVDKMIEVMSRQQQGAGRAGQGAEGASTDDGSQSDDDQDEVCQQDRAGAGSETAAAAAADDVLADQGDLAAVFGSSNDQAALRDRDALELHDLISGLDSNGLGT
eukprot:XP_001700773.1 predicted protein [Chlamydomonas reinhardtii]